MNKVLQSIARRAGIAHKRVSCQKLRDLFALQRLRAGDEMDDVLKKLGLAPTTSNEEAKQKYKQLMKLYGA
jgi:DnaJ-domain-containing protein 1